MALRSDHMTAALLRLIGEPSVERLIYEKLGKAYEREESTSTTQSATARTEGDAAQ